jgi:hypothetical protein
MVATRPIEVRSVGCSGLDLLNLSSSRFDPYPSSDIFGSANDTVGDAC